MSNDTSKKLFIFLGVLFVIVMLGPYLGIHILGEPELPERISHSTGHALPPEPILDPALMLNDEAEAGDEGMEMDDGEDQ